MPRKKVSARMCAAWGCDQALPPTSRADRVYCSSTCARRVARARTRARSREEKGLEPTRTDRLLVTTGLDATTTEAAEDRAHRSRTPKEVADGAVPENVGGEGFQRFAKTDWPVNIIEEVQTASSAAVFFKVSKATISAWMDLYNAVTTQSAAASAWEDDEVAQNLRDYALSSFGAFTEVFFPDELVPDFHEEWDDELTSALDLGERTVLLAPQRHGKTSFSVRQCLYRIAKNPDIRIILVGKTQELAKKVLAVVRQYLENDPHLLGVLLPPDTSFRPPSRRGLPWTNEEFVVATRTKVLKSPTMVALGIGGSILGRDADFIIIDDPIDRKSSLSQTERDKVSEWFFTDFNSRIEEWTGVMYIGSRQHKDDLPGRIIKNNAQRMAAGFDPDWKVLLYRSHDTACSVPLEDHPEDPEDEGNDCILWPQLRSARWLAEQQRSNPDHFERNYQNNPTSDAFKPVKSDDIEMSFAYDEWLSTSRDSPHGLEGYLPRTFGMPHAGMRMVASVDPAVAKRNAAVLWCYTTAPVLLPMDPFDPESRRVPTTVRALVDYAEPNPGSPGVMDILDQWRQKYHVVDWVFETNYFADQIANDRDINDYKSRYGLKFWTHYTTAGNKHDPRAGVLSMLSSMGARPSGLLMPGSTPDSRRHLERFTAQMLNYDPEATHYSSGRKRQLDDDLIMAAWFGWYWIEQRVRSRSDSAVLQYGSGFNSFEPSYWGRPPWEM